MRVVIQRVSQASVAIEQKTKGAIDHGMLILLGIEESDSQADIEWLTNKIISLRIFDDEQGVMNLSVNQVKGSVLLISQFTLHASTKKGARPSYIRAAHPSIAIPLYEQFIQNLNALLDTQIETGEFGANMQVSLINDGPVTILIDSKNKE